MANRELRATAARWRDPGPKGRVHPWATIPRDMMRPGYCVSRGSVMSGAGAALSAAVLSLPSVAQTAGFRVITARTGTANLRDGDAGPTPIRGFEGTVPGHLLRVKRGDELKVRLVNELVTDMSVHWH